MNKFLILRGAPASGKSTFCNSLTNVKIVSSDEIRIQENGYKNEIINGKERKCILQDNPNHIFNIVKNKIEMYMGTGEDVILDSCALMTKHMEPYIDLAKHYSYEMYAVEFQKEVTKEECLRRNKDREFFVPEYVIENFYKKVDSQKVPYCIKSISVGEAEKLLQE